MKLSFTPTLDRWLKPKRHPALAWIVSILWLLLIGFLAFFWNLGNTGLVDETEPLFAEASRQMTVTGNWITPMFNGVTRFDKPILIYWCQAIAYRILGVNEWAVRLPSALSAMGLVSLSFYTLWSFGSISPQSSSDRDTHPNQFWLGAGLGSALIGLHPHIMIWARTGVSDMLLTGCMDGALLSFFLGYAQPTKSTAQERWYLAFYVLAALAVLTKGPVGIVLPCLIIGAFVLYLGNWRQVWQEQPRSGGLLFIGLVLPWYILVIQANGWNYINSFFGYHNLERFTQVLEHNLQPWYFYLLVILLGFAPWSVYLPVAIAKLKFWQRHKWRSTQRKHHLGLFAFFWFIGVLSFFTIAATKLPSYVLPLMPAAAILVALMWSEQLTAIKIRGKYESKPTLLLWSGWLNVVFLLILAAVLFYSPNFPLSDPAILNPRQIIQQSGLPIKAATIWMIAAVIMAVLLWYRQWWGVLSVNLLGFVAFLIFAFMPTSFLIDQARQLPLRELTAIATQAQQPDEPFFMVGFKKPSVVFYSHRLVNYFLRPESAAAEIKKIALNQPQPPTLLILSQPKKLVQLGLLPSQYQNLGQAGTYQLIRIAKSRFEPG